MLVVLIVKCKKATYEQVFYISHEALLLHMNQPLQGLIALLENGTMFLLIWFGWGIEQDNLMAPT